MNRRYKRVQSAKDIVAPHFWERHNVVDRWARARINRHEAANEGDHIGRSLRMRGDGQSLKIESAHAVAQSVERVVAKWNAAIAHDKEDDAQRVNVAATRILVNVLTIV